MTAPFIYQPPPSPRPRTASAPTSSLAADLRTLADLADAHPELVEHLATTLGTLTVVLPVSSPVGPDQFADAVQEQGAMALRVEQREPWFVTRAWMLPGGSIRLALSHLCADALASSTAPSGDALFAADA